MARAPAVLLILVVMSGLSAPFSAAAQEPDPPVPAQPQHGFRLEQNYPNPVNADTYIPFYLEEQLFKGGENHIISIRIYNILRQLVAVPSAVGHPRGKDVVLTGLRYTEPGRKIAYWDGKGLNGRRVPSGMYFCELVVNERSDFIRIVVVSPKKRSRFPFPIFRNRRGQS